ncbi:hypothetical protein E1A91_A01G157800v1 [Gossypium mustelinum]|uniref:Retroviral polymerase SH3-like domain-containing protein n=1 Tax=Gossypium mustelinum TaxID=34275 RepID=A0A5D3AIN7_GOSMU|nr:hypothetical protein E1A91_A01G157800v1 [Gossypium mustelinum]
MKGWRCMDPKTKKVIISHDVLFDEVSCHKDDANGNKEDSCGSEPKLYNKAKGVLE